MQLVEAGLQQQALLGDQVAAAVGQAERQPVAVVILGRGIGRRCAAPIARQPAASSRGSGSRARRRRRLAPAGGDRQRRAVCAARPWTAAGTAPAAAPASPPAPPRSPAAAAPPSATTKKSASHLPCGVSSAAKHRPARRGQRDVVGDQALEEGDAVLPGDFEHAPVGQDCDRHGERTWRRPPLRDKGRSRAKALRVRILFITATRIGDAVLSTGLLDHLIRTWPQAKIVVACGPVAEGVFARMPNRAWTILLTKRRLRLHWLELWREVAAQRWDLVVDLRGSAFAWLVRARRRVVMRGGRQPGPRLGPSRRAASPGPAAAAGRLVQRRRTAPAPRPLLPGDGAAGSASAPPPIGTARSGRPSASSRCSRRWPRPASRSRAPAPSSSAAPARRRRAMAAPVLAALGDRAVT